MIIFYVIINNKIHPCKTLVFAEKYIIENENLIIYADEYDDDLNFSRGCIRTLIYKDNKYLIENPHDYY